MKKVLLAIGGVVILALAYWLISPIWRVETLNEELPGLSSGEEQSMVETSKDLPALEKIMEQMTPETKEQFMGEMEKMSEVVMEKAEPMVPETRVISSAELIADAHEVKGKALFVESGGKKYLRFEDLDTVNGPDLRIYLSSDLGVKDSVDLGPIKATRGNVNYELPEGVDLEKYNNALIWCRAFSVLFSYGKL